MQEDKEEFVIGWHIGDKRLNERDAYCLMRVSGRYIIDMEESIYSLEDKVKQLASKYNATILKQE